MKSLPSWKSSAIALVSFTLGALVAPALWKTQAAVLGQVRQPESNGRSSSTTASKDEDYPGKTRAGLRDEKKKPAEPRVSFPLSTVSTLIKRRLEGSDLDGIISEIDEVLVLLGATPRETEAINELLKQAESELKAEEPEHIKVSKPSDFEILIDKGDMTSSAAAVAQKTKNGIRSILPPDLSEALVSSIWWDNLYPIEKSGIHLSIVRKVTGELQMTGKSDRCVVIAKLDRKFEDGMPIPADQLPSMEEWKPYLKDLTLLPQDGSLEMAK